MSTWIVVIAVVVLFLAGLRLWLTANRLDRLHIRTQAAWAALDGAMARRIVATRALAVTGDLPPGLAATLRTLADAADSASRSEKETAEARLSRALEQVSGVQRGPLGRELADSEERVMLANQFYNDAVRDTRALRASWFPRLFRLAGHAPLPDYFAVPVGDRPATRDATQDAARNTAQDTAQDATQDATQDTALDLP